MKKILLASVALFGFAGAASAADLPARAAPPAPVVAAVPVFTWTGFYVGVNAGVGFNSSDDELVFGDGSVLSGDSDDDASFIGGGQIGYNYQFGSFVVGVEGDLQWADFGSTTFVVPAALGGGTVTVDSDDWFGTVRARAGVAFDRALIYATGGFAFTDNRNGWTVGGGIEYAFTNNLSAKIEGLYVNLEDDDITLPGGVVANTGDTDFGVVRAGLNYRFSTY